MFLSQNPTYLNDKSNKGNILLETGSPAIMPMHQIEVPSYPSLKSRISSQLETYRTLIHQLLISILDIEKPVHISMQAHLPVLTPSMVMQKLFLLYKELQ